MKRDVLVTIRTFTNLLDAEVAVEHLESHGIPASIKKDDTGSLRPHLQLTQGVDVVIRKTDTKKAEKVLVAMKV
jgi:hypothetical protein